MTTTLNDAGRPPTSRGAFGRLAVISARHYVSHPMYLVAVGLLLVGVALRAFPYLSSDVLWDSPLTYELYLGIGGIFIGASLARQDDAAEAIVASAPTDRSTRTLALFAACAVPAMSAAALMTIGAVVELLRSPVVDMPVTLRPSTGPIGRIEYLALLLELGPVACFGGAALGVLVGRRARVAGAVVATAIVLLLLEFISLGAGESIPGVGEQWWARVVANAMPYGHWQTAEVDPATGVVGMRPGSPAGHVIYALALCGLVVVVGAAEGNAARLWRRGAIALGALAAAGYTWALLG